ncbi:hypothetical protein [Corynebacterium rhinophilum]|uniref:hypothetical protein n=1 Tax=Corynebacterium rhinophilum TaxID=3050197 RepID=UPI00254F4195|nr:hypothetical protein [Corynebacterium sp. MSK189]MDK8673626.1 hypothetical protein [Corynebacterium sp. MSK189]
METKNSRKIWAIVIAIIVLVIAIVAVFFIGKGANQEGESRKESQEVNKADSRDSDGKSQEDVSASGWSEDTSDVFGRSLRTPKNGSGQPMGKIKKVDNFQCESEEEPSKLTLERVHSAETLWSENQGPGRVTDEGVPSQYAHTPEGAVLSAWNSNALVQMGGHDVALRTLKQQFTGGHAKEAVETLESNASAGSSASVSAAAPEAFRITSCSQERVIGDVAVPMPTDAKGNPNNKTWMVIRVSAKWEDGDWKAELDEVKQSVEDEINNLDGWEQWKF